MSDIPSDIMNAALELNEKIYDSQYRLGTQFCRPIEIAKAIYEERKRCARIAEMHDEDVRSSLELSKAILSGEMKD